MQGDWIPYVIIALIALLIFSCGYVWRNRAEIFEMAGIDPPDAPGFDVKKKPKKKHPLHLNRKRTPKNPKYIPEDLVQRQPKTENPKPVQRKQKPHKEPKVIRRNHGISDLPIDTDGKNIRALNMNNEGFLIFATTDGVCHMYVSQLLNAGPEMLAQHFSLGMTEISNVALMRAPEMRIVFTSNQKDHFVISSLKMDEEKGQFELNEKITVPDAFKSSCQGLVAHPKGDFVALICDSKKFKLYSKEGELIHEQEFEDNKVTAIESNPDCSKLFVGAGRAIYVYNWNTKKQTLTQAATIETKTSVRSMAFCPKTGELAVVTNDDIVTMYNKRIEKGKIQEQWEIKGARIVIASPTEPYIAVFSGKSAMKIVQTAKGTIYAELQETHEGLVDSACWSVDNGWIFTCSKAKPKVESFCFNVDK